MMRRSGILRRGCRTRALLSALLAAVRAPFGVSRNATFGIAGGVIAPGFLARSGGGEAGKEEDNEGGGERTDRDGGLMEADKHGQSREDVSEEQGATGEEEEMHVGNVDDSGPLDTHIAWRSLLLSGLTAFIAAGLVLAAEAPPPRGHAAILLAFYCGCFGAAYPVSRFLRKFHVRPPMRAYFGEGRLALLFMAGVLLVTGVPVLAGAAHFTLFVCLVTGAMADAFWLSEVAGRRGVGLRQAVVLAARFERRRPGGVDR